jgi:hypothetical protein
MKTRGTVKNLQQQQQQNMSDVLVYKSQQDAQVTEFVLSDN